MFYLKLYNPFPLNVFKSLFEWNKIFCLKVFEIQLYFSSDVVIDLELDIAWTGRDHAGLSFSVGLCGFVFEIQFYDSRHWDYENNKWEE